MQTISIFHKISAWCSSVTGILTILVITISANRMILTAIREKHGKTSTFYRNSKNISGTLFLIFFINCVGSFFRWLFRIGMQTGIYGDSSTKTKNTFWPWIMTAIIIILYIAMLSSALKRLNASLAWIATVILCFGIFIIHHNIIATIVTIIISGTLSLVAHDEINAPNKKSEAKKAENLKEHSEPQQVTELSEKQESQHTEEASIDDAANKIAKKNILIIVLWIISIIAAYIAGEFSLIPRVIECVRNRFKKPSTDNTQIVPAHKPSGETN